MRRSSFLESSIFYVVVIFALSSLPRLLFTIFSITEGYGYDGSAYWIITTYSFYLFFIIFSAALLMVVAMRTINEVKNLSFVDPLTKLFNRRGFENRANVKLNRVDKYSLLALDLDYFKRVNDQYGHQVGDQTLKAVSKVIRDSLRVTDIAGRFGGEEFVVLLPNTDFPIAQAIAERLRNEIEQCEIRTGLDKPSSINVTASFGISTFDVSKNSLAQSLRYVDSLLYKAKNEGRNRVFGEVVQ